MKNIQMPKHVAIILDGNGRWAKLQNKTRTFGHEQGAKNIRTIVNGCLEKGIPYLTIFCFSTENWNRPKSEIKFIFGLPKKILNKEKIKEYQKLKIKLNWIGFEDKMPKSALDAIKKAVSETKANKKLTLTLAMNYGSQDEIVHAVNKILKDRKTKITKEEFNKYLFTKDLPPVDLLIRTSGEERISNFLLWQISYAEIIFNLKLWPEYSKKDFFEDLKEYSNRNRRFGRI